jgi:N-acetylmuramoyl-L-alanine amidase
MRTFCNLITAWALLFCQSAWSMHVVLDPGHGGNDAGATNQNITESDITLKVAKFVAENLQEDSRFQVTLTRNSDTYLSLENRANLANKVGDLFISIHVNSSTDSRIRGKEIYFQNQLESDEESLFLSSRENQGAKNSDPVVRSVSLSLKDKGHLNPEVKSIVEDLERNHRFKKSGQLAEQLYYNWSGDMNNRRSSIRQAPFFVVSNIDKPAALIEIGYLTNKIEALKLTDPNYQRKIAKGIYKAIVSFKENLDKPTKSSLD